MSRPGKVEVFAAALFTERVPVYVDLDASGAAGERITIPVHDKKKKTNAANCFKKTWGVWFVFFSLAHGNST